MEEVAIHYYVTKFWVGAIIFPLFLLWVFMMAFANAREAKQREKERKRLEDLGLCGHCGGTRGSCYMCEEK